MHTKGFALGRDVGSTKHGILSEANSLPFKRQPSGFLRSLLVLLLSWHACKSNMDYLLPATRQRDGQSHPEVVLAVLKRTLWVRDTTPSWCIMQGCGLEPLQFDWFCAAMRFYNSLAHCNSTAMKKILHANMRLSTWSNDYWSSHIPSMEGLAHFHVFEHKLLNCEPINLSRTVVDLRTRHLHYREPSSSTHPVRAQSQTIGLPPVVRSTYNQGLLTLVPNHVPFSPT